MRSASIALLGLLETRISWSRSGTQRILRPLGSDASQRSHEPLLEPIRGGQASQSVPNKNAKPSMEFRPGFAFGAKVQMCAEVFLFLFA
jgi:hypothetical protein